MTDVILRISGMDCGACAVRIVRALQGLPGLREVSVSDTADCACLTYDEMAVDLGEIACGASGGVLLYALRGNGTKGERP